MRGCSVEYLAAEKLVAKPTGDVQRRIRRRL